MGWSFHIHQKCPPVTQIAAYSEVGQTTPATDQAGETVLAAISNLQAGTTCTKLQFVRIVEDFGGLKVRK